MEGVGKATCARDTRGQGGPRGHARGAEAAGDREAGRGEEVRGGPGRGGSGEAGGAAPEESASGRGGRRLAPPRGTERATCAPARETPATGGASTSAEGGLGERRRSAGTRTGGGETIPGRGEGHPLVLCPRATPGPGERLRGRGARAGRREVRGRRPGASARLCGAGAARWRAVDPACAGQRGGGLVLERRAGKAERGWERERVCVSGEGRRRCRPDPNPCSAPPRASSGEDPARAVRALRPKACHPSPPRAFVAGARKPERGTGRLQRGGQRGAEVARGAPRPAGPRSSRGGEGLPGASGRPAGRRGDGERMQRAQLGEVERVQRRPGVCSRPWVSLLRTKCHFVTSARVSSGHRVRAPVSGEGPLSRSRSAGDTKGCVDS